MPYDVLVVSDDPSPLGRYVAEYFNADTVAEDAVTPERVQSKHYRVLVLDRVSEPKLNLAVCERLLRQDFMQQTPLVVLTSFYDVRDKVKALEIGCDDLIDGRVSVDEACARITKSIFHRIASAQLNQRSSLATAAAQDRADDREACLQFLLKAPQCDNLDQLGQQLFAALSGYGLSCSLQMRSVMGRKDMEAHGMAKDLESQLLWQMRDGGRYVDFGRRTVVNFDRASLLIKNMPTGDPERSGRIRDCALVLLQGVSARILALEDRYKWQRAQVLLSEAGMDDRLSTPDSHSLVR